MVSCIDNMSKILDFRNLKDNWNENGAKKPEDYLLIEAIDFIRKFTSVTQPQVFLTANNSIQFEWECNANYLEYELSDDGIKMFETFNGKETSRELDINEYMAINYITRCIMDRWYPDDKED